VTTTEERKELMEIAKTLEAQLRAVNSEMIAIKNAVSLTVCKLIGTSNELKVISADEITRGEAVTVRKLTTRAKLVATVDPPLGVNLPAIGGKIPPKLAPGKRACSLCRHPGHWAKNCPNAHLVQAQKKAAVAAREALKPKRRKK